MGECKDNKVKDSKVKLWFIDGESRTLKSAWGTVSGTGHAFVRGPEQVTILQPGEFFVGLKKAALYAAKLNLFAKANEMDQSADAIRTLARNLK